MRTTLLSVISVALAGGLVAGGTAVAASNRVWVSGHGVDQSGCGAPTSPCRSLQYAHDAAVSAGGEIDILDPAGYGALNITKAVSIVNDGAGAAGVQSISSDAIAINAGPNDTVVLRGLSLQGSPGVFGGFNGLNVNTAGRVLIDNCTVYGFNDYGIMIHASVNPLQVEILDTLVSGSAEDGVGIFAQAVGAVSVVLDRVDLVDNAYNGLEAAELAASPAGVKVTVSNSDISANGNIGVYANGASGAVTLEVDASTLNANSFWGMGAQNDVTAHLTRSVVSYNGADGIGSFSGPILSGGDNLIVGNGSDDVSALVPDSAL